MFMHKLCSLLPNNNKVVADSMAEGVLVSLADHVYKQTTIAMIASLFCATIIFISLYEPAGHNASLLIWGFIFMMITLARMALAYLYKRDKFPGRKIKQWHNLYILGSLLGGISWGLLSVMLLPQASSANQTLMVLMLAGVTAGAIPLSAAIPGAAIAFLFFSVLPFIITMAMTKNTTYLIFDIAMLLYLFYSIILSMKAYQLIKSSVVLEFKNDILLHDLEISNIKLEQAATHDPLTQVANLRLFHRRLEGSLGAARKNHKTLALFYLDLDGFKQANDRYGHAAGDYILITVIERLRHFFRKDDNIARLGGDEFAIMIENIDDLGQIEAVAKKICYLIATPILINNFDLKISASIGVSLYPYDGHEESQLIRVADRNMYQAKKQGGNKYYISKAIEVMA